MNSNQGGVNQFGEPIPNEENNEGAQNHEEAVPGNIWEKYIHNGGSQAPWLNKISLKVPKCLRESPFFNVYIRCYT